MSVIHEEERVAQWFAWTHRIRFYTHVHTQSTQAIMDTHSQFARMDNGVNDDTDRRR